MAAWNSGSKYRQTCPFRIGMTDNFTNEKFIEFPAGQNQYGLTRNGEWGQVSIPLVDFSGLLAFQDIGYMFAITSVDGAFPTSTFEFAVDDIVWKGRIYDYRSACRYQHHSFSYKYHLIQWPNAAVPGQCI